MTEVFSAGFPHSDTHGSLVVCTSPWLFAAFCVLHRLLVPRHSPFALLRLTSSGASYTPNPCLPACISRFSHVYKLYFLLRFFLFFYLYSVFKVRSFFAPESLPVTRWVPFCFAKRALWRQRDLNPRPPACKAGALPAELYPHWVLTSVFHSLIRALGLGGLEPPTSRLSGARSNQLSYKPMHFYFLN